MTERGNTTKMSLSNYSGKLIVNSSRTSYQSNILNINYNDVYVSLNGITHKFLDFYSQPYHRLILEEKQNGAYIV